MSTTTIEREVVGPAKDFPASKYAVDTAKGLIFFEVKSWKKDKATEVRFFRRLVGAPGDWTRYKLTAEQQAWAIAHLEATGPQVLAKRYADEYTECARCGSPLSDPLSRERGVGPVCWDAF